MLEHKIEKLIEETGALLLAPALYPGLSSMAARLQAEGIESKKDLGEFKKKYSGFSNYKTYGNFGHNLKRGATAGTVIGVPLGGLLAAQDGDDSIETGLGIGGLSLASGLGGATLHTALDRLFKEPKLKEVIEKKERQFK